MTALQYPCSNCGHTLCRFHYTDDWKFVKCNRLDCQCQIKIKIKNGYYGTDKVDKTKWY